MTLNCLDIVPESILPVPGITLGFAEANIRKPNRKDLLVMHLVEGSTVSGVFTMNRFCAAPVQVCRMHLKESAAQPIRALLVNTGNANAGTGEAGLLAAEASCTALATILSCEPSQILPFSTGVILEPLPVDRLIAGLPQAVSNLDENNWYHAAETIMTTDTRPKAASHQCHILGHPIIVTGISKGAGMIMPNMATMLGFIACNAKVSQAVLDQLVKEVADESFNCISVDGDTSTNDAFMLLATGASDCLIDDVHSDAYQLLKTALLKVAQPLAQMIVRDGEGATKLMTIVVESGKHQSECRQIAYSIANSPLVKTAFFASDPNLGRLLMAIGKAGVADLDVEAIDIYLNDICVVKEGGRYALYEESAAQRVMQQSEMTVRVVLHRGNEKATVWTCDFSHEYVTINAEYRS